MPGGLQSYFIWSFPYSGTHLGSIFTEVYKFPLVSLHPPFTFAISFLFLRNDPRKHFSSSMSVRSRVISFFLGGGNIFSRKRRVGIIIWHNMFQNFPYLSNMFHQHSVDNSPIHCQRQWRLLTSWCGAIFDFFFIGLITVLWHKNNKYVHFGYLSWRFL